MNEIATIKADADDLNRMIEKASGGHHEDLLIRVADGNVSTLMQTYGRQVVSYCDFDGEYFDDVTGECEAIMPVGGQGMDSEGFRDYMKFAEGSGTVKITFLNEGERGRNAPLATRWRAEGSLTTELRLDAGDEDLDAVPWDHPPRWTPDNQYASKRCLTDDGTLPEDEDEWIVGPVVIQTTADTIREKIIEPANFVDGYDAFPITVEDGEFAVKVEGKQQDNSIRGPVNAESVEGPDAQREFKPGFEDVFGSLSGQIRLQTAPGGDGSTSPPMSVVQETTTHTVRHLLSALVEQ